MSETEKGRTHPWTLFGTTGQSVALCCKEHGIVGYPETPDEMIAMRDAHEATLSLDENE